MMVGKQLHLSDEKMLAKQVISVKNDVENVSLKKPVHGTGLWTSTYREETRDSDWVDYDLGYGKPYEKYWFLLTPAEDARLYVIDTMADLRRLLREYPCWHLRSNLDLLITRDMGIDFEHLAREYDGLHVTAKATANLRLTYPVNIDWTVESTCWFRWVFTTVERIEIPDPVSVPHEGGTQP